MEHYLLLALAAVAVSMQDIFKKKYNNRSGGDVFLFGGMIALFATLFFIAVNRDWSFRPILLLPSLAFAVSYASSTVFTVLAIRYGSLAKTSLIVSCSLLIPCFYGILFLGEWKDISLWFIIGLVLLIAALFLINYQKGGEKITFKWVVFVLLAFVGNGMCSTVQKAEQIRFGDDGRNVFMIAALAMVAVILFAVGFSLKSERKNVRSIVKKGVLFALVCGVMNGLTNFLVIYLNTQEFPASIMFPVISGGSIVFVFVYSILFQKERFRVRQYVGFFLGVLSVVLLNL